MNTYVILRRGAWGSPEELGAAAERSKAVGDERCPTTSGGFEATC